MLIKSLWVIRLILIIVLCVSLFYLWLEWNNYAQEVSMATADNTVIETVGDNQTIVSTGDNSQTKELYSDKIAWVLDETGINSIISSNIFQLKEPVKEEFIVEEVFVPEDTVGQEVEVIEERPEIGSVENPFVLLAVSEQKAADRAIILNGVNSQTYIIKVGDIVDGFKIEQISINRVIANKGGQEITISYE